MVKLVELYADQLPIGCFDHQQEIQSVSGNNSRWKPGREARCCAFSKNNKKFAWSTGCEVKIIACENRNLNYIAYNGNDGNKPNKTKIDCGNEVKAMEFAPDFEIPDVSRKSTSLLAVGLREGGIKIWDTDTGDLVFNLSDHLKCVTGLSFAACGSPVLISCSLDKTIKVWDLEDDGNMTQTLREHTFPIYNCAFSPTDKYLLASVGMGKMAYIWKLEGKRSCEKPQRLRGHKNDVVSCSWSPDGALLATASHDSTVAVWDPYLCQVLCLLCHQNPMPTSIYAGGANGSWVSSVSFSQDGTKIATVCEDNRLRLWKLWMGDATIKEASLTKSGYQCCFSPDGKYIAVGKENGSVTFVSELDNDVMPLTHICRLAARKVLASSTICNLDLPPSIKKFLLYQPPLD